MGFDEGSIVLDSQNSAYYAGSTISGRIVFDQGKHKTIHGIYVSCKGYCKVHWTTTRTHRVNKRTTTRTIHHESYEEYFKLKNFVIGDINGECNLEAGHHEFEFRFQIPYDCPSSFEGAHGHIRYRIKAVMVTSGMFSFNKEKYAPIIVHTPVDLNQIPYCKEPIEYEINDSYCCWCVSAGSSEIQVRLPAGGYCPGQIVPLEVSAENNSSVEIVELKFAIKVDVKFIATTNPATKYDHETLVSIVKGPIPPHTTRNWQLEMEIPAVAVYNFNACRYIDIDYYLKVSTEASNCHNGSEESHPIVIGSIPLVGFQDTVQNPLHDQMPQPMDPMPSTAPPYPTDELKTPLAPYPIGMPQPSNAGGYSGINEKPTPSDLPPPYPGIVPNPSGGDGLKTGTIGFVVPGDGEKSKLPSSPPGSTVTSPSNPAANPYASASAPEPSTPDTDTTTADGNTTPLTAYNPNFPNK